MRLDLNNDVNARELIAWRELANNLIWQNHPIMPQDHWPKDVAYVASVIDSFVKGMMQVDELRPTCPTCHGDPDFDCPENDYDCDGRMSFERMAAWCLYVINLPSGPLTRDELWDVR